MKPFFETEFCTLYLADCLEAMREMPDKAFDLAIVDPPYGHKDKLTSGGTWAAKYTKEDSKWNVEPPPEYFSELRRVAINQIVWGGNYFTRHLDPGRCFITWEKPEMAGMHTMADSELALTSFDRNARIIKIGRENGIRIHIVQKPVALYRWLLTNYAKPGDTILDTHLGSGSIAIACHDLGFHLTGYEIDEEYLSGAVKRIERHLRQPRLFTQKPEPMKEVGLFEQGK